MPWIVGIDEAGYGPNLGPLVMTSVACRVPEGLIHGNLWKVLRPVVRRHVSADNGRLLIEDSKVVYSPARGLLDLETGVLATLCPRNAPPSETPYTEATKLKQFVGWLSPAHASELQDEPWYSGESTVPAVAELHELNKAAVRFDRACKKQEISWGLVRSVIVCPASFNRLLDQWGSKGAILGHGLQYLLPCNQYPDDSDEPVFVYIDKHGGRNDYFAILQNALMDGMVAVQEERASRSVYRVIGARREMRLSIEPRADGEYFCVALASMVSKYVRELLMAEFNQFWQNHVPELRATAGYPGDASRFYKAIRPALLRLGIPERAVWREK
jgi:hypothetical protein